MDLLTVEDEGSEFRRNVWRAQSSHTAVQTATLES